MSTTTIKIRKWLAEKNGYPRVAEIEVISKTQRAVQVKGCGDTKHLVFCMRCGAELTHPVSQQVGIGPICCGKLGIDWSADTSPEALAALRERLMRDTEFEGWLPLSQIEVLSGSLDAPAHVREEKPKPEGVGSLEGTETRQATLYVTPWIAEQKGFGKRTIALRGKIKRATSKAICVRVKYGYFPRIEDSEYDDETRKASGITRQELDGKPVDRIEFPNRKQFEVWLPVSQITDATIDEPVKRRPAKRRPKHEEVAAKAHEVTEYERWSNDNLPF
jgi:hypothetical protein